MRRPPRYGGCPGLRRAIPAGLSGMLAGAALLATLGAQAHAQLPGLGENLCGTNRAAIWIADTSRAASYLNQFDLQLTRGPWLVGARLEFDEEARLDPEPFSGLRRRFAEYRGPHADLRVGTFYATFGRGLLLRAEEDETVRLDRDLDGARGAFHWRSLTGQAVIGRPRDDKTHRRDNLLSGLDVRVGLLPALKVGAGYVRRDASRTEKKNEEGTSLEDIRLGEPVEELVGGNLQWSRGIFEGVLEGVQRYVWGMRDNQEGWVGVDEEKGHALYGAFTFTLPGYAWLIEGKHYRRFDAPYSTLPPANSAGRPINEGRDERGLAIALTANQDDYLYESAWSWAAAQDEPLERLSAEGSVRRDWWGRGALKLGAEWVRERALESYSLFDYSGRVIESHSGPRTEATYYLSPATSLEMHGWFYAWTVEGQAPGTQHRYDELLQYNEVAIDLSLSVGYARGATLSIIHTTDPVPKYDNEDNWVSLELAWSFSDSHNLKIRFGEERGGIVCSGGVCHYEPPFTGVRAEITSRL
jgi:hypothetical protein